MHDIIAIGSATVDVFVNTHSDEIIRARHHDSEETLTCYPLGSKILIKELKFTTGGGGTNTAVSFSRLGLRTAYLGNLGDDENGKKIINELKKEKIEFIGTLSKEQTNYSVILDSIKHDRTILAYREASESLDFNRIKKSKLKAKWFYFSSMTGKSFKAGISLMQYAKKNGIKVAYNPSTYQVKDGVKKLKPILERTDVLIFNREEAAILLGKREDERITALLEGVRQLGPKIVVITDGGRGAHCSDGVFYYFLGTRKIRIVETTGAGDAFASSFISGLAKGNDIEFSMRLALANAESVIQHYGAKNKLLTWKEAMREMKKCPKVIKRKL
ncbi:MAG: carbohydrate kinase family protein [Nanoarchaeota archaeon]|nr:carbohydrate kinase family protein [Nanoarchaeota archaeon]